MARTFLPTADGALLQWARNFSTLLSAHFDDYGLSDDTAIAYATLFATYQTKLNASTADITRGKSTVHAKNVAKQALIASTRSIAGQIGKTMTVTDQQKIDLGLIVRKKPTPIPAPTTRPTMALVSAIQRTVTVRIFDDSTQFKRAKAPNTIGAKVYTFIGASYPSDPTLWAYQGDATRGTFTMAFADSVPNGAQVWICSAWFTRRGETGPVSMPISTNVQGGGSTEQQADLKIAA